MIATSLTLIMSSQTQMLRGEKSKGDETCRALMGEFVRGNNTRLH